MTVCLVQIFIPHLKVNSSAANFIFTTHTLFISVTHCLPRLPKPTVKPNILLQLSICETSLLPYSAFSSLFLGRVRRPVLVSSDGYTPWPPFQAPAHLSLLVPLLTLYIRNMSSDDSARVGNNFVPLMVFNNTDPNGGDSLTGNLNIYYVVSPNPCSL